VSPLAGLNNLTGLKLENDPITDYSPLESIYPNLTDKDFELK
jgi:Leucine-rich repeat (LRR) protein